MQKEFTVRECAVELEMALTNVYPLLWEGRVKSRKVDGRYLIPRVEVEKLKQKRESRRRLARERAARSTRVSKKANGAARATP
jgi:hypothetical protein